MAVMARIGQAVRAGALALAAACARPALLVLPALTGSMLLPALAQAQVAATLMADRVYVDGAGRLVATGSVEVWHGSIRMRATQVTFDRRRDVLDIVGPITINDGPGQIILADQAQLSPGLRAGLLTGARVVLDQQLQIAAARVERQADGINRMEAVVASSCPVCAADPTPLWEIRAQTITHNENSNQLLFERAQFRFRGVPVFYLPRLRLPGPGLDRARGFLRPEFNLDSDLGLSVGMPYFIPIGETRDLTLTPVLSTEGMVSLGFRWRAARPNGGVEIGGQISRDGLTTDDLRGYGYVRALFMLRNDFRLSADLIAVSDRSYLETYNFSNNARLQSDLTLERIRRDQAIRGRLLAFHSLRVGDTNDTLPNVVAEAEMDQRIAVLGGEARVQIGARGFRRRSTVDGDAGRDVDRAHLQVSWRRTEVLAGGIVATGAVQARVDHVRISDDSAYPDPVTRRSAQAMIEFRWPWAASDAGVRQVIEPVVQVIASRRDTPALPNDDHTMPELDAGNLFALSRYSGEDAQDDGARLNAGLRWSRFDAEGWSSEALIGRIWRHEVLSGFDLGHVQPLGRDTSHWLLAGRVGHVSGYSASLRLLLDPDRDLSRAETNLAWNGRATGFTTRYLYLPANTFEDRPVTLSEWSVDVTRRFANGWSGTMGWEFDVAQNQFAAARTGLEFRNECLAVDLSMTRHFVTATNPTASTRFTMQVELLGIGGRAPTASGRTCRA